MTSPAGRFPPGFSCYSTSGLRTPSMDGMPEWRRRCIHVSTLVPTFNSHVAPDSSTQSNNFCCCHSEASRQLACGRTSGAFPCRSADCLPDSISPRRRLLDVGSLKPHHPRIFCALSQISQSLPTHFLILLNVHSFLILPCIYIHHDGRPIQGDSCALCALDLRSRRT